MNWPDDIIEEFLEDILGILDPLIDLDRLEEAERFLAETTPVVRMEVMD